MLNQILVRALILSKVRGAFVLIGSSEPRAVVMSASELVSYGERVTIVGYDKANAFTFGASVTNALPCTVECMTRIALEYVGPYEKELKTMCARIATGLALDDLDGGDKVESAKPIPRKPSPSVAKHIAAAQRIAATQASV